MIEHILRPCYNHNNRDGVWADTVRHLPGGSVVLVGVGWVKPTGIERCSLTTPSTRTRKSYAALRICAPVMANVRPNMETAEQILERVREAAVEFWSHPEPLQVNSRGAFGNSPLFTTITWGDLEAVESLLGAGADVNFVGEHGETPLHHAISSGEFKIARRLVESGANCEAEDQLGKKPRDYCWEGEWPGIFGSCK